MGYIVLFIITIFSLLPFPALAQNIPPSFLLPQLTIQSNDDDRDVYLYGAIDDNSAQSVIDSLKKLDKAAPGKEIILHITSPGGMVYAGLSIYDAMQGLHSPLKTVCEGYCMSMAALLLACGDSREATRNATIMVHQLSSGFEGKLSSLSNEIYEAQRLQDVMNYIFSAHTGLSVSQIIKMESYDHYMSPLEAKRYGIIDKIQQPVKRSNSLKMRINE